MFPVIIWLGAVGYFAYLFFWQLGATKLTNWDEAWYADIARTIAQSGDFLRLVSNGSPYFDHPPFFFTITAVWFALFGVSEFWARFSAALCGFLLVLLVADLARRLFSWQTGVMAAFILASSIQFLYRARTGNLDATLMLFVTTMFYGYARFRLSLGKQPNWLLVMWLGVLGSLLTKSFVWVLPLGVLGVCWLFLDRLKLMRHKAFWLGAGSAASLLGLWYWAMIASYHEVFTRWHFGIIGFKRLTQAAAPSHLTVFWFLPILKSGLKIWSVLLPPALILASVKSLPSRLSLLKQNFDWRYFLLLFWFLSFFVPFSLAANKDGWHILPTYPGLALLIAACLWWVCQRLKSKTISFLVVALVVGVAIAQNIIFRLQYMVPETTLLEATVAQKVSQLTNSKEVVVLDDHAFPVTLFYSQRKLEWIRVPGSNESENNKRLAAIVKNSRPRFIITKLEHLQAAGLTDKDYQLLYTLQDKVIVVNYR